MGNLGGYQRLTTAAKKVGGPKNLVLIIAGMGAVSEFLVERSIKEIRKKKSKKRIIVDANIKQYSVKKYGISNEGLEFEVGDRLILLEVDGDAVLIEKDGDENNPYFVSAELLKEISDYKD